jgi:integrating conjugative element protein (TIGR03757 family)
VSSCALLVAFNGSAAEIWVITDREHPVKVPPGARLIELDAASAITSELSTKLPSNPEQAAKTARQRLKSGGLDLQRRLARAYQGIADAWSLGVIKIPAVVVDRRYVVYGEPDARRAVSLIERYRREPQ